MYTVKNWARSGPVFDIYKIGLAELSFYELNNHNLERERKIGKVGQNIPVVDNNYHIYF